MIILILFLPTILAKPKLKTSARYAQDDNGCGHAFSLSGKMPKSFEMSYSVSQDANRDAAWFVVDDTHFDFKSPSGTVSWERDECLSPPEYTGCNEVAPINADRTVHISFSGDQSTTDLATSCLSTGTPCCECPNGVLHIFLNALIRGLGIILIFFCSWLLLRSFIDNKSHLRPSGSNRESRTSSIESTAALLKEDNEPVVDSPLVNAIAASGGGDDTPVPPESENSEVDAQSENAPSESDTETEIEVPPSPPSGFHPPRPENPQPTSSQWPTSGPSTLGICPAPIPCAAQSTLPSPSPCPDPNTWPAPNNSQLLSPRSAVYIPSSSSATAAPLAAPWSPHMDVSNLNLNPNSNVLGFSSTAAVRRAVLIPAERNHVPPPPPPQTILGYNPVLGLPRPSRIETILQVYDFIFLIDDSGSMMGSSWTEARESVNQLANWILDNGWDRDGITLRFLNSDRLFRFGDLNGISDKNKIRQLVNTVHPDGGTPTGRKCSEILNVHIDKLERAKSTPEYAKIKPLILVVITDGAPSDCYDYALSRVLTSASKRLADTHHHPNSMAIQFVQVGGDPRATQALRVLTQLNTNGMVDAIMSNDLGSLSPDKLGQLMLGGVHPNVRARGA